MSEYRSQHYNFDVRSMDIENSLDKKTLLRRLPELRKISGPVAKMTTKVFLDHCPDYFWMKPSSSSGKYHPEDECGDYGLWLHSKRAFATWLRIERSAREQETIDFQEAQIGRASILLHDIFKFGQEPAGEHTHKRHDEIAADFLKYHTELPVEVIRCVRSHNGPWSIQEPETELEKLHHLADMICSDRNIDVAVLKPTEELKSISPNLKHLVIE